jgi:hypothetical protein
MFKILAIIVISQRQLTHIGLIFVAYRAGCEWILFCRSV